MAKGHKPVAGSRGFWPRKRAKRIYPRLKCTPVEERVSPLGFAGYKAGMTQVTILDTRKGSVTEGQEVVRPVTVLDTPALVVLGIKTYKKTPYGLKNVTTVMAEHPSKDLSRKTRVPKKAGTKEKIHETENILEQIDDVRLLVHTKPRESGIGKKKPELFEIPLGGELKEMWEWAKQKLGNEIKVQEVFTQGEFVDAISVTKGKGFQGPVKRFGIKVRGRKHTKKRRHIGNIGPRNLARVLPGKIAMAGQLGFQTRTEFNKQILKLGNDGLKPKSGWTGYGLVRGDYIILEGSVPGPRKRLVMLRKGLRAPEKSPVELKKIHIEEAKR